ncbi:peptidoglycan editing factor PgeF [Aquisalibacillus elongatus]|uniref:Purine nucleoside phosphorylase n=1 Tax=Aquisalibacillus elongatus TaxID=485577 RepID=A0A3N5BLL1_9BACI|nr:peptidoglycan editing factor PgeF [Aquisalibacillus elongatus]RPF56070.1 hypothetical protein EDC24_0958 [Aquisalibacillus elongatus]
MDVLELEQNKFLRIKPWDHSPITAGFSIRKGGYSKSPYDSMNLGIHVQDNREDVLLNRKNFSEWIQCDLMEWKSLNQVHSRDIIDLSEEPDLTLYHHEQPKVDADGLITNEPTHVLTAFYADCVPLLFKSKDSNWVGIAHAGWKGTVQEIGTHMTKRFKEKGASPENLEVVIGPCISKEHYEIDQRVIDHIPETIHHEVLTPTSDGHAQLDLKRLNFRYLVDAGVKEANIHITEYCTYRDEDLFFSHRRDHGITGRMMAFIKINE